MRVALVTETYFPQVNGVSRTLGQLVQYLRTRGDQVQIIQPDYGEPIDESSTKLVTSMRVPFYPELLLPIPPFLSAFRAIDEFEPDIIHVATEFTLGFETLRHAHRRGIPIVSSFHTNFDQYTSHYKIGWTKRAIWRYLRWFHNRTRETYVPSRATIAELEIHGLERLVLWPRGVDSTLFRPDRSGRELLREKWGCHPDDVVVGHVSRIAAEKNIAYLGDALEFAAKARPQIRLLIVGDGPSRPDLEAQLGERAIFAGYRTGDDLADHYAGCDLFAFASLTETFGNVILEAMASGLSVVAVRAGGPGDTIHDGSTGLFVEPNAPASVFADRLIALVDDKVLRARIAEQARRYALTQTWEAIMSNLRDRYERLVEQSVLVPRR